MELELRIKVPNQDSMDALLKLLSELGRLSVLGCSRQIVIEDFDFKMLWDGDGNHKLGPVKIVHHENGVIQRVEEKPRED